MGGNGRCLAMQRHRQPAGQSLNSRIRSPSSSTTSTHARLTRRVHNATRPPSRTLSLFLSLRPSLLDLTSHPSALCPLPIRLA